MGIGNALENPAGQPLRTHPQGLPRSDFQGHNQYSIFRQT